VREYLEQFAGKSDPNADAEEFDREELHERR
jgi:hypothetical protein